MTDIAQPLLSQDKSEDFIATLHAAQASRRPLYICGGNSKRHLLGRDCEADVLAVSGHRGIVDYQPRELVMTARAGTTLTELLETLYGENQTLAFEPPLFKGKATLGGTLACNLSGPARPWRGAIRDMVLGVQLLDGNAQRLNFGGKVMKNVAGYDVSRLQAGALGTLGVLTEISLKIMPRPEQQLTLCYEMSATEAVQIMNQRAAEPKPLSGAFWVDGQLYLRLEGTASAVQHTARQWGGQRLETQEPLWESLRELTLPFFAGAAPLWRFSHKSTAPVEESLGATLIDWAGAQRWVRGEHSIAALQQVAHNAGGHVTCFRGGDRSADVRSSVSAVEQRLQQRLKATFDPLGILNPGRLYSWL